MVGELGRLPLISADEWPLGDGGQQAPQALAHHWSSSVNSDLPTSHVRALLKETWLQWHLLWALTCTPEGTTCTEGNLWETLLHQRRPLWLLVRLLLGASWTQVHADLRLLLRQVEDRTQREQWGRMPPKSNLLPPVSLPPTLFSGPGRSVVVSLFLGLPPCPHSEGLCCSFQPH